jgi:hypothetical protein
MLGAMRILLRRIADRIADIPPARLRLVALTALICVCAGVVVVVAANNPKPPAEPKPDTSAQQPAVDNHPNYTELSGKRAPAAVWLGPPREDEALFRDETYKDRVAFVYVTVEDAARIDGGLAPVRPLTVTVEGTDAATLKQLRSSLPVRKVPVKTGIRGVRALVDRSGSAAYVLLTEPQPALVTVQVPDATMLRPALRRLVVVEGR